MTAENNRQPTIQPSLHDLAQQTKGEGSHKNKQIIQDTQDHRHQCTNSSCLCCSGLGILPNQEQDQSRNRDTASQKSPADSAIIFHIWIFILICPTVLAYRCVVIDWLSAISAIHDKIPPYLGLLSVYLKAILSSRRNFVNCKKSKTENYFLGNQG